MAKKNIENHYTFEYINPEKTTTNSSGTSRFFMFFLIGLIALGLVLSTFFPAQSMGALSNLTNISFFSPEKSNRSDTIITTTDQSSSEELDNNPIVTSTSTNNSQLKNESTRTEITIKQEKLLKEIVAERNKVKAEVDKLMHQNQIQLENAKKQQIENTRLTKELSNLNEQLLSERTRNKTLNSQISLQDNKNDELAVMLEEAITNANASDRRYLDSIATSKTNTSLTKVTESEDATIVLAQSEVKNQVALEEHQQSRTANIKIDYNNSVGLDSTISQVDAILATMQGLSSTIQPSSNNQSSKNNRLSTTSNSIAQDNDTEDTDILVINLQNQINKLIQTGYIPSSSYRKSLNEESEERNNAVRSIVVKKGETLWSIAKRAYGSGSFFNKIIEANPHIEKDGKIVLRIGQVIHVPI